MKNSDREWEQFGRENPDFGVLSRPRFIGSELTGDAENEFFRSGEQYVEYVFRLIERLRPNFQPQSVLDFGCGVGRLLIPFAKRSECAIGVDVSPSMLDTCRRNCQRRQVNNATLVESDDNLSRVKGRFDLVNSYIVLQHIVPKRGIKIIERLLNLIGDDGIGVVHFPIYDDRHPVRRLINAAQRVVPIVHNLANLARGRPWNQPLMEMHRYDLSTVMRVVEKAGFSSCYVELIREDSYLGVTMIVRREGPRDQRMLLPPS